MSAIKTEIKNIQIVQKEGAKQEFSLLETPSKKKQYLIHSSESDEPIGCIEGEIPAGYTLEAYASKGGDLAVLHAANGAIYFLVPGATISHESFKVSLYGDTLGDAVKGGSKTASAPQKNSVTTQAMILGAGLGTRIMPLTEEYLGVAKPALPWVGENTVIGALIELLSKQGIKRVFVNTCYQAASVREALNTACKHYNLEWFEIAEERPTGTAGGVLHILNHLSEYSQFNENEPLMVVQGDAVSNVNLTELLNIHADKKATATIGCQIVSDEDVPKFGIIATDKSKEADQSGAVQTFLEKPLLKDAGSSRLASTGFYVLGSELYPRLKVWYAERLKQEQAAAEKAGHAKPELVKEFDFAKDVFNMCLGEKLPLHAQEVAGFWCDIGNPAQYIQTIAMAYNGDLNQDLPTDMETFYDASGVFYWPDTKALADANNVSMRGGVIVAKKAYN